MTVFITFYILPDTLQHVTHKDHVTLMKAQEAAETNLSVTQEIKWFASRLPFVASQQDER